MKPNIIFMHSHNTGQFVQPYGYAVPTPNLQRLAEEGVLFRRAFATAPTCSPSRASFLTGMMPHSCGMLGLAHRGFAMSNYDYHIARVLNNAGYFTAMAGVEHTAPDLNSIGYQAILSTDDTNYPQDPPPAEPTQAVVDFLTHAPSQPFFLSFGLNETHRPFPKAQPQAHSAEDERYSLPPLPLPDTPETRADTADFKAAARVMDTAYGRVLRALDETGLAENTLVFCFADHGLQFPRHMCNLTDYGLGVYLIIRGPGGFRGGQVCEAMVSLSDLAPTVYDLAQVDCPDFVQGQSLRPLVKGIKTDLHSAIFGEVNYHAAYEPMRAIRTERFKYIRRYDDRKALVLPNVDDTPSKAYLLDQDWTSQPRYQELLYDLVFDPAESQSLADQPDKQSLKKALSQQLTQWMQETNDPLLHNEQIAPPPGSQYNHPDGLSPREPTLMG